MGHDGAWRAGDDQFSAEEGMTRNDLRIALQDANVGAFLHAIRLGEGTADEGGYWRIVGGGTFADAPTVQHPCVRVWIERYGVYSTAAGAYQIIKPTWYSLQRQYGFEDFNPESQDEAAVALIAGRGALEDVKEGRFAEAVRKCSAEWASLPGSTAGQRKEAFSSVLKVYLDHGGKLA